MSSSLRLAEADAVARLARRDAALFTQDPEVLAEVAPWMGWVGLPQTLEPLVERVVDLAARLSAEGLTDAVLLGMGGSSLASIVLSRVLGSAPGGVRLHVLDTTCPETVLAVADTVSPATTVVLVSSKSGGTLEPLSLYAVFRERFEAALGREAAGRRFVALTDPGSKLEAVATAEGFAETISTPADVGGRYSALTAFHLLPAALLGLDVSEFLQRARAMDTSCCTVAPDNPAARLAAFIGDSAEQGRDKLTIVSSPGLESFGLWVEQLVAESVGKIGRGVVPVVADGPRALEGADADRAVVIVRFADDASLPDAVSSLAPDAPLFDLVLGDRLDVAGEFVRWEYATALTGFLMGVNPFDQPNVAEAKAATASIMDGTLAAPSAVQRTDDHRVSTSGLTEAAGPGIEDAAFAALSAMGPGDYLALLAYVPEAEPFTTPLHDAADAAARATGKAVTFELGPRYLHSTGQLHKGGPATGVFVMLLSGVGADVAVPGSGHSLRDIFRAQALGDFATLAAYDRPVVLVEWTAPDATGAAAAAFGSALKAAARRVADARR
jgi:transaldolase / glucose-6-phosphate isomerase